jgi:hypothetical protein
MNLFIIACLVAGIVLLTLIIKGIYKMSIELDNANAALVALQAAEATVIAKIDALKAVPAGVAPAAVQALADGMNAAAASLTAAAA